MTLTKEKFLAVAEPIDWDGWRAHSLVTVRIYCDYCDKYVQRPRSLLWTPWDDDWLNTEDGQFCSQTCYDDHCFQMELEYYSEHPEYIEKASYLVREQLNKGRDQ